MIKVFKIGGNVINDSDGLRKFIEDFSAIPGKKILVHGGGREASELSKQMGIQPVMIEGRRVTDKETLDIVTMVYAGLINKRIVDLLQQTGNDAIGLSGADGNLIPASKRNPEPIDYGYVGDIDPRDINTRLLSLLLDNGLTPVVCAICRDYEGGLLNCNADSIASALAQSCSYLESTSLTFCFEKAGVLAEVDDDNSLIPVITPDTVGSMIESGQISGGMLPKVTNALKAVAEGVQTVRICSSKDVASGMGTWISKDDHRH